MTRDGDWALVGMASPVIRSRVPVLMGPRAAIRSMVLRVECGAEYAA